MQNFSITNRFIVHKGPERLKVFCYAIVHINKLWINLELNNMHVFKCIKAYPKLYFMFWSILSEIELYLFT